MGFKHDLLVVGHHLKVLPFFLIKALMIIYSLSKEIKIIESRVTKCNRTESKYKGI